MPPLDRLLVLGAARHGAELLGRARSLIAMLVHRREHAHPPRVLADHHVDLGILVEFVGNISALVHRSAQGRPGAVALAPLLRGLGQRGRGIAGTEGVLWAPQGDTGSVRVRASVATGGPATVLKATVVEEAGENAQPICTQRPLPGRHTDFSRRQSLMAAFSLSSSSRLLSRSSAFSTSAVGCTPRTNVGGNFIPVSSNMLPVTFWWRQRRFPRAISVSVTKTAS